MVSWSLRLALLGKPAAPPWWYGSVVEGRMPAADASGARSETARASDAYASKLAAIEQTRRGHLTNAAVALAAGLVGSIVLPLLTGVWCVAPIPIAMAAVPATLMIRVASRFRPLRADLLTRGHPTPAVVLAARPVGLTLRAFGFPDGRRGQRQSELRIEVHPPGQHPYEVVLTTFDAPRPNGLEGRPITVYVDPADPRCICPDWRGFNADF